jgi:hypothetical protein
MQPQLDLNSLVTALVSAGLLTFAIVYVARSRRSAADLDTPLSQAFSAGLEPVSHEMFSIEVQSGGSPGLGLAASAALHLVAVFFTPMIPYLFPAELRVDLRRYRLRMMEFRVPQPLFYPATPAQDRPQRRVAKARIVTGERAAQAKVAAPSAAPLTATAARPRFQAPESFRAKNRDVILQPDQPPEMPALAPLPLPRTFLWAQAPAPVEETRTVGALSVPLRPFSLPNLPPELRRPNREMAVGDLPIGEAPIVTFRPPILPVRPANVAPLSRPLPDAPAEGELPATPLPPGNPMNLVALLSEVAPPAASYIVGIGNRLPESGAPGTGGRGVSDAGAGAAPAPAAAGAAQGTHADLLASAPNSAPSPAADSTPAATDKPPATPGSLGVIIVQQTPQETGLEGGEVLTGQPVYTVYLDVPGSPRRWVLQYCVPGSVTDRGFVQPSEGRIRILPRRSIQPPTPIERVPVDTGGVQATIRRLVIYGLITENGEIHNVRLIRSANLPVDDAAVTALQKWTFRPAMRGDTPVAVEALFGIPLY